MEFLLFILLMIVVLFPLVLGIVIPVYREHRRITGSVVNYDSTMRKFVYRVNLSYQQIIELLNTHSDIDELSCTFDFDNAIIRFSEYCSHRDYYFQVQECGCFFILRLEQVALIGMQSGVPYKLNPFLVNKLQAEMIPFSQYAF